MRAFLSVVLASIALRAQPVIQTVAGSEPPSTIAALQANLSSVASTAVDGLIYTASYVWNALGNPSDFVTYPLWVADPNSPKSPIIPKPFTQYTIWQYSFKGVIAGIAGPVDLDKFNGTEADFQKLLLK
jgi:GH25 family lysozyme M1 (1,4-beta-N-acetylmuramidase)